MLDVARPREIRDVNQAVDSLFDPDERPELRDVPDLPLDARSNRVAPGDRVPGFGSACFIPREIRLLFGSTLRTTASTKSATLTSFDGWRTLWVQDISETWTSPSIPGSSSTKAPYSARLTTFPRTRLPTGYLPPPGSRDPAGAACTRAKPSRAPGRT